jgi:hypothetical protein
MWLTYITDYIVYIAYTITPRRRRNFIHFDTMTESFMQYVCKSFRIKYLQPANIYRRIEGVT